MQLLRSSNRVFCPRAMMAFHGQRRPIMFVAQGTCGHATPDVFQQHVLSKGADGIPRSTSFDRVLPKGHASMPYQT